MINVDIDIDNVYLFEAKYEHKSFRLLNLKQVKKINVAKVHYDVKNKYIDVISYGEYGDDVIYSYNRPTYGTNNSITIASNCVEKAEKIMLFMLNKDKNDMINHLETQLNELKNA